MSGASTKRSTPGGRTNTKSSLFMLILHFGKWPALYTLHSRVQCVSNLKGPKQSKVAISFQRSLNLEIIHTIITLYYYQLVFITSYYVLTVLILLPITIHYFLLCGVCTFSRLRSCAICRGSSMACTSTLLRSDCNFGRSRRWKCWPWYSCRKLATFFAR